MVVCLQGFLSESIDSQQKGLDFERPILEIEAKAVIYILTIIFTSKIAKADGIRQRQPSLVT